MVSSNYYYHYYCQRCCRAVVLIPSVRALSEIRVGYQASERIMARTDTRANCGGRKMRSRDRPAISPYFPLSPPSLFHRDFYRGDRLEIAGSPDDGRRLGAEADTFDCVFWLLL
jgi:hypothetical protein